MTTDAETAMYQVIGKSIREARTQSGLTQGELAEKSDLSDNFLSLIENGKRPPSLAALIRIAQALDVSVADLCAPRGALQQKRQGLPVGHLRRAIRTTLKEKRVLDQIGEFIVRETLERLR